MRRDRYDSYKSYSLEKTWELLIPPAEQRAAELREAVSDPERQEVKHLLEELLHGAEEIEDRFKELLNEGLYVPDWKCNSDGFFFNMDRYYRDQIVGLEETITSLREMVPKVDELDVGKDEKAFMLSNIYERIQKNQRFIKYNKTKIFEFSLKMNKKKELHERKMKLDAEIRKIEADSDESETTKIIGG